MRARRPLIHAVWSAALPDDLYYRVTIPQSGGGTDVAQLWMVTAHVKRFAAGLPTRAHDLDAVLFDERFGASSAAPAPLTQRKLGLTR